MSTSRTYSRKPLKRKLADESDIDSPKKQKTAEQPALRSPKTPARDLSHIFDNASPSLSPLKSPSRTPSKLAKRMLGRSKTESSLESKVNSPSSSQLLLDRTSSLPTFASPSEPASRPLSPSDHSPGPSKRSVINKRTYAGKSRSFLVELPTSSVDQLQDEDDFLNRESYTSLRARWGVDLSEDDPFPALASPTHSNTTTPSGSPSKSKGKGRGRLKQEASLTLPDIVQPHKSIIELRNRGENRRFLDEVGYLLEGLGKDETLALKKASTSEILNRLCDAEFARQAKAADFLTSTWEALIDADAGKGNDKTLDVLLAFFCALVSRDLGSSVDLAKRSTSSAGTSSSSSDSLFICTIFKLLASLTPETDLLYIVSQSLNPDADLKKLGITKPDRTLLKSVHSTIVTKSQLFASKALISTSLLLTHTLSTLPPSLISSAQLPDLLESLRTNMTPLTLAQAELETTKPGHSNAFPSNGKPSSRSTGGVKSSSSDRRSDTAFAEKFSFVTTYNLLVLLDLYLLGQWVRPATNSPSSFEIRLDRYRKLLDQARDEWLINGLVAVGIFAELAPGRVFDTIHDADSASKCTEMTFRVLVSLTHADYQWSEALIKNESAITLIVRTIVRADLTRYECLAQKIVSKSNTKIGHGNGNERRKTKPLNVKKEEADDVSVDAVQDHPASAIDKQQVAAQALDRLCLALGLLTNLVQVIDEAKNILRNTLFDPGCARKSRPCIRSCTCPSSVTILHILIDVYRHHIPDSAPPSPATPTRKKKGSVKTESYSPPPIDSPTQVATEAEADASFLLGHLSILFGLLMTNNLENQSIILSSLPLESSSSVDSKPARRSTVSNSMRLDQLVENAQKVGAYYAAISRSRVLHGESEGNEDSTRFSREQSGDAARGEDVAKEVVLFLEELRNGVV